MTATVFDIALERRFTDSPVAALEDVTSADTLLIRNNETGEVLRLPFSVLTSAVSGALTGYMRGINNLSEVANAGAARANLGLGNIDNTSDADKPVSTATQAALDIKLNKNSPNYTGGLTGDTGIVNIGSGQLYKDADGNIFIGSTSLVGTERLQVRLSRDGKGYILVRNDSSGSSAGAGISLNAYGNSWGIEVGSAAKNSNTLAFYLDYGGTDVLKFSLDTSGNIFCSGNKVRISNSATPASASATGSAGDICWDANYVYVCVASNTWKRAPLISW